MATTLEEAWHNAAFRQFRRGIQLGRKPIQPDRSTAWYRRWAMRVDRSKYSPNECQRAGKR